MANVGTSRFLPVVGVVALEASALGGDTCVLPSGATAGGATRWTSHHVTRIKN
jgi:hypothetical protein